MIQCQVKTNSATFLKHHQQGVSKVLECLEEEIVFHLKGLKYSHIIIDNGNAVEDATSDFNRGSNIENAVSTKTKQSKTNLNLKDLCVTAGLVAYFLSFFFALIVAWSSRDAVVTTNKKGKWDKSIRRTVAPHAFKFLFRNTIIFYTFVLLATSFNVWAQNHQVCLQYAMILLLNWFNCDKQRNTHSILFWHMLDTHYKGEYQGI